MKHALRSLVPVVTLIGALVVSAGCSTVPDARYEMAHATSMMDRLQVLGDEAAQQFHKRSQMRLPAKLAVADISGGTDSGRRLVQTVQGLAEDDDTYVDVVSLETDGAITPEALRVQAAGHQADLELVLLRREEVHANSTGLGLLNVLVVPIFVVPTQSNDVRLTVRALVRDVRNGLVYTTFDDHQEATVWSSVVSENGDLRRIGDELYADCVARMRETLARKLAALERATN